MRLYFNYKSGTTSSSIAGIDSFIYSNEFQSLPPITGDTFLYLILDPHSVSGDPEIIKVTSASPGVDYVQCTRGQESTTARAHPVGTQWIQAAIASDYSRSLLGVATTKGDVVVATGNDDVARLAVGTNNQVLMADSATSTGLKYAIITSANVNSTIATAGGTLSGNVTIPDATADGHALNRITADGRYVNVTGDSMSGPLNIQLSSDEARAINILESSSPTSKRAQAQLGEWVVGQDTGPTNVENFGIGKIGVGYALSFLPTLGASLYGPLLVGTSPGGGSSSGLVMEGVHPSYAWRKNAAPANQRVWDMIVNDSQFELRTVSDDNTAASTALLIDRSATSVSQVRLRTGGVDRLSIDSNGLQVASSGIYIRRPGNPTYSLCILNDGTSGIRFFNDAGSTDYARLQGGTGGLLIGATVGLMNLYVQNGLQVQISPTEAFFYNMVRSGSTFRSDSNPPNLTWNTAHFLAYPTANTSSQARIALHSPGVAPQLRAVASSGESIACVNSNTTGFAPLVASAFTVGSHPRTKIDREEIAESLLDMVCRLPRPERYRDKIRPMRSGVTQRFASINKRWVESSESRQPLRPNSERDLETVDHTECTEDTCGGTSKSPCALIRNDHLRIGMMATEIPKVFPEAAHYDSEGVPIGWDVPTMVAALVGTIGELNDKLNNERLRNDALEKRFDEIDRKLNTI